MAGDDAVDDLGEVCLRVDAVRFASFHKRGDRGPVLAATVGAGEERILSVHGDRPDRAFDHVRVDLDAAIVEEA
jgi:hypothetical protein